MSENTWNKWLKDKESIKIIEGYDCDIGEYDTHQQDEENYPITIHDLDESIRNDKSENKTLLENFIINPFYHFGIIEAKLPKIYFKDFPCYVGHGQSFNIIIYEENGKKTIEAWPLMVYFDEKFREKCKRDYSNYLNNNNWWKSWSKREFLKVLENRIKSLEK